ncbi:GAF and ANTAR domain-containing protein [Streptomyces sp. ODS28]|uniref:GAF and ANTAR domain-containing protein n=1 Tax=Streptomyces sp. ODS28 TaxID=3136688 RepID=UPI0031E73E23
MTIPREQRLADTFVLLSDTLVRDFDLVDFFQTLTDRCVELLDIAAAGLFLARPADDGLRPCAWTPPTARTGALMTVAVDGSPATDCFRTATPLTPRALGEEDVLHPAFLHQAREDGYTYTAAVPLRLRTQLLGSMLMLNTGIGAPAPSDLPLAQALTDQAAIGLVHQRALAAEQAPRLQLHAVLHSRIVIEQAQGFLSERLTLSLDDAYGAMRHHARTHGQRLTTVATHILDHGLRPAPPPQAHIAE